jgi:hypothetical protein
MMEFVNGKDDIPYMMENKNMFETTNQLLTLVDHNWLVTLVYRNWISPIENWKYAPTYSLVTIRGMILQVRLCSL